MLIDKIENKNNNLNKHFLIQYVNSKSIRIVLFNLYLILRQKRKGF